MDALGELLAGLTREFTRSQGPVKWCKRCGRKHPSRARCHLIMVEREAKSGRTVKRLVRP